MHSDDLDLLRKYAVEGSQSAFAELVSRYLGFVYSAALRQVRSPQLAEEVAQSVFLDLSRNASRIKSGAPVAWLCRVTRRTAIDVIRQESRRQSREQTALEVAAMKSTPSDWAQVEPLLDEAIEALKEKDRTAVLLRYFENKSLREVGQRLGVSDDVAQKRVSRAIDQLRATFLKRGVAIGAVGLATELSAYAVQAPPASLSAAISAAAGTLSKAALPLAATVEATRTLAMTTVQKTMLMATAAAAVSVGLYQTREVLRLRDAIEAGQHALAGRSAELSRLKQERDSATTRLKAAEETLDSMLAETAQRGRDATLETEMHAWIDRAERLQKLRVEHPELTIPELQLLDQDTWFSLAKDVQLDTDAHIRDAFKALRSRAENLFANKLQGALRGYLEGNTGKSPNDLVDLLPFFDSAIDPSILERYELLHPGTSQGVRLNENNVSVATKFPIDIERDSYWRIGAGSVVMVGSFLQNDISEARTAFAKANDGNQATEPIQLLPFLKWPVDADILKKHFGRNQKP